MGDDHTCPIDRKWSLWRPCPVCGALGPWFENGECVDATVTDKLFDTGEKKDKSDVG
jgi:hypothetical protein